MKPHLKISICISLIDTCDSDASRVPGNRSSFLFVPKLLFKEMYGDRVNTTSCNYMRIVEGVEYYLSNNVDDL